MNESTSMSIKPNGQADRLLTLRDGRTLAYVEFGDPEGIPCFFFHGIPGSRRCLSDDPLLHEKRIRVIAPDRPGMGLSSPHHGRTLASWAGDVAELADSLGLDRFHVAGASGGGPHALACGVHLRDRVRSVTLISTAAPPEALKHGRGMALGNRLLFFCARHAPWLLGWQFRNYANTVSCHGPKLIEGMKRQLCPWDRHVMEEIASRHDLTESFLGEMGEAFRQGHEGVCADFLLVALPWNLDLEGLDMPILLWHGEADTLVPVEPVRAMVPLLPGCTAHFIPEAGHFLLESEEVGRSILQAIRDHGR